MRAELTMVARPTPDVDRRMRLALMFVAAFLAVEPPLRALLWSTDPDARHVLHSDAIWLSLALCAALAVPLAADIRAMVAPHRALVAAGLLWGASAAGSALLVDNSAPGTALRWPFYLGFALCLLAALRRRPGDGAPLLVAMVVGFLGLAAGILIFIVLVPLPPAFDWVAGLPGAFNIRNLGYEALAVAVVGSLYRPRSSPVVMMMRTGAVVGWGFLFWSGGRGSLLAALVTLGIVTMLAEREERRAGLAEVAVLAALGAALSLLHTPPSASLGFWRTIGFESVAGSGQPGADVSAGRFALWAESLRVIAANPWFGIGEGQMRLHLASAFGIYPQPHNLLLQGAIAWGVAGGSAFLVAVAFPLRHAVGRTWRGCRLTAAATAGLAMALAMAVQSMVDGTLFHPRPVTMFLIGCCIALAGAPAAGEGASTSRP